MSSVTDEESLTDEPPPPVKKTALRHLAQTLLPAGIAWLAVLAIEATNIRNESLLVFAVPPFELAVWLVAAVLTLILLRLLKVTLAARVAAGIGLLVLTVCFNNWSVFEPNSYYTLHKLAFDAVADGVRHGTIGATDDYYGDLLPLHLRDLSTDGRASVIDHQDGRPIVFLPEFLGIPDDAAGYVFYDGVIAPDRELDLYGAQATVQGAVNLGDGWWYIRPGD
jgi:hypothetical protein